MPRRGRMLGRAYLSAHPDQNTPYGRKYYTDDEEKREDGLRRENRPVCNVLAQGLAESATTLQAATMNVLPGL